jgi:hypothetical protein
VRIYDKNLLGNFEAKILIIENLGVRSSNAYSIVSD